LSLKQANDEVDSHGDEFDSGLAALYGMVTEYDEQGNYKFPEGFDQNSGEWLEGFEAEREAWEAEYAAAQARWEKHKQQMEATAEAEAEATRPEGGAAPAKRKSSGTLADDESLAALREKLSSGNA